jgi:monoamine oxidase
MPILIIGAGIAGLSAANFLREQGKEVVILEATDRVGGRISSDRSTSPIFERGASWLHRPKGNPLTELARAAGVELIHDDSDNFRLYDIDGSAYPEKTARKAERKLNKLLRKLKGDVNLPLGDVFYQNNPEYLGDRLWTFMLSAYLEFDLGGDISRLSSLDYNDDDEFFGTDFQITNGYDRIPAFLADGLDIRFEHIVTSIDYSGDEVVVQTARETFVTDQVIIAVPLGVLKAGMIGFSPALPDRIAGPVQRLEMGTVNKFFLTWDEAFWDAEQPYFGLTTEEKGEFNYFVNLKMTTGQPALVTFTFGAAAAQSEAMSDEAVLARIMDNLKTIHGVDIPAPTSFSRTNWASDPFTLGSYTFATTGTRSTDFKAFEEAIGNKLFFAGEHTSFDYRGTVHGAMFSGVRAAGDSLVIL